MFANTGRAGAVFHVYDKLHLDRLPRRYMVEAGKRLGDDWAVDGRQRRPYDLWVLGPNGFHRHFKGDLNALRAGGAALPEVRVGYERRQGDLYLQLRNEGRRDCRFTVQSKKSTRAPRPTKAAAGTARTTSAMATTTATRAAAMPATRTARGACGSRAATTAACAGAWTPAASGTTSS